MHDDPRIAALEAEVDQLRSELLELRHSLTGQRIAPTTAPTTAPATTTPATAPTAATAASAPTAPATVAPAPPVPTRRTMLRHAAVAAAGAAGAAATVAATASPAAANNLDPIKAGDLTTATAKTELRYTSASGLQSHILAVQDGTLDLSFVLVPSAILGMALGRVPNGVYGATYVANGAGVVATGDHAQSRGIIARGDKAVLSMAAEGVPPQQRNSIGGFVPGDMVFDSAYTLWLCVGQGGTGAAATWRRLTSPDTIGSLTLNASPIRAYDSRTTGGRISADQFRDIQLKTGGGVPDGANGALLNITATETSTAGFLQAYKPGAAVPAASNINWDHANSNVANNATVLLDASEQCRIRCGGTNASTQFIVDVLGWYR